MSLENEVCLCEQPYEKCIKYGAGVLTDTELLAVFLRTGYKGKSCLTLARNLLGNNIDGKAILRLVKLSYDELIRFDGIGQVKAVQLMCMLEMSKRIWKMNLNQSKVFTDPETIACFYMEEMRHLPNEQVRVMYLNTKGVLIRDMVISSGTVNSSLISPREIFIYALKCEAVNIVLIHNHPSGDPTPSGEDISITNTVQNAGKIIGIRLIDHVIIGDNRYVSLAEKGII